MAVMRTQLGAARTSRADGERSEVNFSFRNGELGCGETEQKARSLKKCASTVGARLSPALIKCVDFLSRVEGKTVNLPSDEKDSSVTVADE